MLHIEIGKCLAFDFTDEQVAIMKSHQLVADRLFELGLMNKVKDSHASCTRERFNSDIAWRDGSKAVAEKCVAALLRGEIRANGTGPRVSKANPIEAEALRLARVAVHGNKKAKLVAWATSFGLPHGTIEHDKAIVDEAIKRYAAKPSTVETATAIVAAKGEIVSDDLDL